MVKALLRGPKVNTEPDPVTSSGEYYSHLPIGPGWSDLYPNGGRTQGECPYFFMGGDQIDTVGAGLTSLSLPISSGK